MMIIIIILRSYTVYSAWRPIGDVDARFYIMPVKLNSACAKFVYVVFRLLQASAELKTLYNTKNTFHFTILSKQQ